MRPSTFAPALPLETSHSAEAVVDALASSARAITAGGAIMLCVFHSFVFRSERGFKLFGLSLASAVLLIGSLRLPAVFALVGGRTRQPPRRPSRRRRNFQVRPPSEPTPAGE